MILIRLYLKGGRFHFSSGGHGYMTIPGNHVSCTIPLEVANQAWKYIFNILPYLLHFS